MNKLDRDGREPLDLLQELEEVLGIASYPMNWPLGWGKPLRDSYDLYNQRLELYKETSVFILNSLEDGDKLCNKHFLRASKKTTSFCKKQEMKAYSEKPSLRVN